MAVQDLLSPITFSPTMITASQKRNVIPAVCEVTVDCRLLPGQPQSEAEQVVRELLGEDDYELECDDCYLLVDLPKTTTLSVVLWDQDIFPNPIPGEPDVDHSDVLASCDFELNEATLKARGLTCRGGRGIVELTIEPHPG